MTNDGLIWNEGVFAGLAEALGPRKAEEIALRFRADLLKRFVDVDSRDRVRQDAHAVASTGGMLGFSTLSAAAKTLEMACLSDGAVTDPLSELLTAKRSAIAALDGRYPGGSDPTG